MEKYGKEIDVGLSPITVVEEASRCLLCYDAPCSMSCPAGTDPAKFIRSLRFSNTKGAVETIRLNNAFGAVCARVCPTERYCELACSRSGIDRPIKIGAIQRYLTDFEDESKMEVIKKPLLDKNQKVAIIGGGPAGLTLARELLLSGYQVTVYEKEQVLGGYLRTIPEYRLPNKIVDKEIKRIVDLGLEVKLGVTVDDSLAKALRKEYDAVAVATGFNKPKCLEMFEGNSKVELATNFLRNVKDNYEHLNFEDNYVIVGGGDVAMDVATTLKVLGVKHVTVVAYEELASFKASTSELDLARKEEVTIMDGYVPTALEDGKVNFKHRFLDNSLSLSYDKIILAVGQIPDKNFSDLVYKDNEVEHNNYQVDGNLFVLGDLALGEDKTVVLAVKEGKLVANKIKEYLGGE